MRHKKLQLITDETDVSVPELTSDTQQDWHEAIEDFLLEVESSKEESTLAMYRQRISLFLPWCMKIARAGAGVGLEDFRARDMREYMVWRIKTGKGARKGKPLSDSTRRQDAICIHVMFKFFKTNGYLNVDPLQDLVIPAQPRKRHIPTPTAAEMYKILLASKQRWDVKYNPKMKNYHKAGRQFFAARNYAMLCVLVDSAARIGEVCSLELGDYLPDRGMAIVRESKTDISKQLPLQVDSIAAVNTWLKVRPKGVLDDHLFITDTGGPIAPHSFYRSVHDDCDFAGVPKYCQNSLRHFSLSAISRTNLLAAQNIAGHTSLKTTQGYLHTTEEETQEAHREAAPLSSLMMTKKTYRERKKVI